MNNVINGTVFKFVLIGKIKGLAIESKRARNKLLKSKTLIKRQYFTNIKDYIGDAISTLNKAIGMRLKMLNENYHFSQSPFKSKEKKIYKQLEDFGIVRPKLIQNFLSFFSKV